MASNQKYKRICPVCKEVFVAQLISTTYCGPKCGKKGYKAKKRKEKEEQVLQEFHKELQEFDPEYLAKKTYLTVKEACSYLEVSRATLYRLRKKGFVAQINIGSKVLFKRELLDDTLGSFTTFEKFEE